jgi:hypothetical protein
VVGSPVIDENMFFGRSAIINKIKSTIHKNHFYFLGDRRSGKTSLLKKLTEEIEKLSDTEYSFQPVPVDFQNISEGTLFKSISREFLKSATNLLHRFQLNPVAEKLRRDFKSQTEEANSVDHFAAMFYRIYKIISPEFETHIIFVLMMDEFDKINGFDESLKENFRHIFMRPETYRYLRLVAAGGKLTRWDRSSPFNFMIELGISQLTTEAARQLILTPSKGVVVWEEDVVDSILDFSQNKPYEIQKLCFNIVEYAMNNLIFEIDDSVLKKVLAKQEEGAKYEQYN